MKRLIQLAILIAFLASVPTIKAQTHNILLFVSHEQTYYSEYIVIYQALTAAGYNVDVRSASTDSASTYMVPGGTDIVATAASLPGGSYLQFTDQFQNLFGGTWNAAWDATPSYIPVNGRIQDVVDMSTYDALVVAGGTGAIEYRVDGIYNSQGTGPRLISSAVVQAASEKLNELALDALDEGKPVMAQCHGASLPVYWRIPSTSGPGEETIGFSLLKDHQATGFPDANTPIYLAGLNVNHRTLDRVTVSSPHSSFNDNGNGEFKIITTRDWYPQTVAHAARTLLNILETFPTVAEMESLVSVLILHGGTVDTSNGIINCSAGNIANDVPCNFGATPNYPADYTYVENLLLANSTNDNYLFTVDDLNITGALPYDPNSVSSILNYLNQYDAVIFFKHWSTGMSDSLQTAIVNYADNGGGVLGLHHALYAHINGSLNKNILINQLFGAQSAAGGWTSSLTNYNLFLTDYGHFVATYGVNLPDPQLAPGAWTTNAPIPATNNSFSYYQAFPIFDEIYENTAFVGGETFGRGVNDINPILSNDYTVASQCHTAGFVKLFDGSIDGSTGKVAYYEAGERRESININHTYGQIIRNTIVWLAHPAPNMNMSIQNNSLFEPQILIYPNPTQNEVTVKFPLPPPSLITTKLYTISGQIVLTKRIMLTSNLLTIDVADLPNGIYFIEISDGLNVYTGKIIK